MLRGKARWKGGRKGGGGKVFISWIPGPNLALTLWRGEYF